MRKIAVITGARSEYGILRQLLNLLKNTSQIELNLIITGMHLSPEFGYSRSEIIKDGFVPIAEVESLLSTDSEVGVAKSIALGILGLTEELNRIKPHFTIILGDRFEILAAAIAAAHTNSILVHISGGDEASGVFDNYYRHMITKISQVHFTSSKMSMERVLLMGENPEMVFVTGSLAYDELLHLKIPKRIDLARELKLNKGKLWGLMVYHPTGSIETTKQEFKAIQEALSKAMEVFELQVILLFPNADPGSRILINKLEAEKNPNMIIFENLSREIYIGLLKESKFIIGNSSSGIIEAPVLGIPAINVGRRQKGRERGGSVIDSEANTEIILEHILNLLKNKEINTSKEQNISPYGDGYAAPRIFSKLLEIPQERSAYAMDYFDNVDLVIALRKIKSINFKSFGNKSMSVYDIIKLER